jgi:4-azaleucine resistance transporter AzlC
MWTWSPTLREMGAGGKAALPLALGLVPFMTIYGVLMHAAGYAPLVAQAMTLLVFAGSQFVTAQLLLAGTPGTVIIATCTMMNLRYALYSASIAPALRQVSLPWRLVLAALLTDETYLLSIRRSQESDQHPYLHWFLLGAGLDIWLACQGSTALGSFLGSLVPAAWHLEFSATLTFLALLVLSLRDRASWGTAVVAGACALLVGGLPWKLGLLVATGVGMLVGILLEARSTFQSKGHL